MNRIGEGVKREVFTTLIVEFLFEHFNNLPRHCWVSCLLPNIRIFYSQIYTFLCWWWIFILLLFSLYVLLWPPFPFVAWNLNSFPILRLLWLPRKALEPSQILPHLPIAFKNRKFVFVLPRSNLHSIIPIVLETMKACLEFFDCLLQKILVCCIRSIHSCMYKLISLLHTWHSAEQLSGKASIRMTRHWLSFFAKWNNFLSTFQKNVLRLQWGASPTFRKICLFCHIACQFYIRKAEGFLPRHSLDPRSAAKMAVESSHHLPPILQHQDKISRQSL